MARRARSRPRARPGSAALLAAFHCVFCGRSANHFRVCPASRIWFGPLTAKASRWGRSGSRRTEQVCSFHADRPATIRWYGVCELYPRVRSGFALLAAIWFGPRGFSVSLDPGRDCRLFRRDRGGLAQLVPIAPELPGTVERPGSAQWACAAGPYLLPYGSHRRRPYNFTPGISRRRPKLGIIALPGFETPASPCKHCGSLPVLTKP